MPIYESDLKRILKPWVKELIMAGGSSAGPFLSGSGTTGRIVEFGAPTVIQNSSLIKSGAGVLTLASAGAYTLTVPATGTAVLGSGVAGRLTAWADDHTVGASGGLTTAGDLIYMSSSGAVEVEYTEFLESTLENLNPDSGSEVVEITITLPSITASDVARITVNIWASSYSGFGDRTTTLRLRRSSVTGTILATHVIPAGADGGHVDNWNEIITDATPATTYVITATPDGGAIPKSDYRYVKLARAVVTTAPDRLPIGSEDQFLRVASGLPTWETIAVTTGSGTSGRIPQWTGTSSLGDSTLIKTGAGVLTLSASADYTLTVADTSSIAGTLSGGGTVATAGFTLTVPATGTVPLGTGAANQITYWSGTNTQTGSANLTVDAATSKIILGADVNIYRSAANVLYTDDSMTIDRGLVVNESGGNFSFRVESDVNTNAINMTGATGVIGFGIGANSTVHIWQSYNNASTGTGVTIYGQLADYTFTPATAPTGYTAYGAFYGATIASAHNITLAYGGRFNLTASTGITITNGIGGEFRLISAPATGITTTLTNVSIGRFSFAKSGVGATAYTTLKVVDIEAPTLSAGTLSGTTAYGLYVGSLTSYGATNPYAIYTNNGIVHLNAGGATDGDLIVSSDTENMIVSDASADTIYLGGQTNGISITKGGDLTLLGTATVYDDFVVMLANVKAPASDPPTWTSYKGTEVPAFGAGNTNVLYFTVQVPHRWKEGSTIEPRFHVAYPNGNAGNSVWEFTYSWANIDGTFPAQTTITSTFAAGGTTDKHKLHSFGAVTATGFTGSSVLLCSLSRLGANAADTYASVIYAVSADVHIEINKMGAFTAP